MSDPKGKEEALKILEENSPAAVETLINDLEHPDWKARQAAANSILVKSGIVDKALEAKGNGIVFNIDFKNMVEGMKSLRRVGNDQEQLPVQSSKES